LYNRVLLGLAVLGLSAPRQTLLAAFVVERAYECGLCLDPKQRRSAFREGSQPQDESMHHENDQGEPG